jgi:hypothetical protein
MAPAPTNRIFLAMRPSLGDAGGGHYRAAGAPRRANQEPPVGALTVFVSIDESELFASLGKTEAGQAWKKPRIRMSHEAGAAVKILIERLDA